VKHQILPGLRFIKLDIAVPVDISKKQITAQMVLFKTLHILLEEVEQKIKQVDCICERVTLFMNKGAAGAMDFVGSTVKGERYILLGAPGAGKSTIWWVKVCKKSCQLPTDTFVCIWTLKGAFHGVLILKGGVITEGAYYHGHVKVDIVELMGQLRHMTEYRDAHFIVDGVDNEHFQSVNSVPGGWLLVSSIGLRFSTGAMSVKIPDLFYMDSWSKEEYIEAIKIEDIKKKIPLEADCEKLGLKEHNFASWVEGKYFYTGGSARLMLEFKLEVAIREIDNAMKALENPAFLLEDAEAIKSQASISTVRQCFNGKYIMLSQYVTRMLLVRQDVTLTFINAAKKHAVNNPALLGWIFELKMLWIMRRHISDSASGHEQTSRYQMNLQEMWREKKKRGSQGLQKAIQLLFKGEDHFAEIKDIRGTSLASEDMLISPGRFNFACFDAAVVMYSGEKDTLITLQATTSPSHSFKPNYVAELVKHLSNGRPIPSNLKVWHVFVLENIEQYKKFQCPDMEPVIIHRGTRATTALQLDTVFWKTVLKEQTSASDLVLKEFESELKKHEPAAESAQKKIKKAQ
jgi:hypothetical protein